MNKFAALAAVALASSILGPAAAAYPEKPVRFILPNAAGAATDTVARIFAAKLGEIMGQQSSSTTGPAPAASSPSKPL